MNGSTEHDSALLDWLDRREAPLVEFARELISIPSPNPPGDETAIAARVEDEFRSLGIELIERHAASANRPNLIARVSGARQGRRLILNGHLDTKPAADLSQWETAPWDPIIKDGLLHGLGSGDMKAAVAAMVYAAGALQQTGFEEGELQVVLTADEEAGSILGARWLAASGLLEADAAVIGEPGGIEREWESISLVSRGALLFRVLVTGTQVHSSISDRIPVVNATVEMAKLIERMHTDLKGALKYKPHALGGAGPTVNVGVIASAGVYYGVYPGHAEFACDIRTLPGMTEKQLRADINDFIAEVATTQPQLDAELVIDVWVPATEIDAGDPVVTALTSSAEVVLGENLPLGAFPGATDAAHFQLGAGIPTVAACGPGLLSRAHAPNERLQVANILRAAKLYALTASRYLTDRTQPESSLGT